MQAICTTPERHVELRDVPTPTEAAAGHVLIKMDASGINPGDIAFLKRIAPRNVAMSLHDVWGVSGAGTVIAIGPGVASNYLGKKVAVYRSLVGTDHTIGTWCEIAQMHHLACVILPDDVATIDYAASLVNVITPYAFWARARQEQHRGVLVTAGSSATGIAMLGIALAYGIPLVSIVRTGAARQRLIALGAENVVVASDPDFERDLAALLEAQNASAVFDGVGGALLSRIAPLALRGSTVYSYGYLGGEAPVVLHTSVLMAKNMTLTSFSNFGSPTVQDRAQLESALDAISQIIAMPHFKTRRVASFGYDAIDAAMTYHDDDNGKAMLLPQLPR